MFKMKRAIHFDFHTVGGIDGLLKDFDAADFAKTLADANVEYINFAAMCNNGYCYYPTKVGIVYPGLKRDILGEVIEECHKKGIGVSAYLNVGINFEAANNHLNWSRMDKEGKSIETYNIFVHDCDRREGNYFVRSMCFNNQEYVEYIKNIVKEIISNLTCFIFYTAAILPFFNIYTMKKKRQFVFLCNYLFYKTFFRNRIVASQIVIDIKHTDTHSEQGFH